MVFLCLLAVFFVSWGIKAKALVEKPRELDDNLNVAKWFESGYTSPEAEKTFVLDSTIEDNYIPIMGKENYFYVVDDNGKVIKIRKRVKGIDGKWAWEDVDGNTDGMKCINKEKNIYETTDENNKKKYVKMQHVLQSPCRNRQRWKLQKL